MKFTAEQIEEYENRGIIFIPNYFSLQEVEIMHSEVLKISGESPGMVLEKDNQTVRALHGCHTSSSVFQCLIQHPRLLEPVQQLLRDSVYLYQFKVNFKSAFNGDWWPWHQDFVFWYKEDGMPSPRVVNVMIFLNEVNEFNGPIYFIPASHKEGLINVQARVAEAKDNICQDISPDISQEASWESNFSADLKYSLDKETITKLVEERGIIAPKGSPGSVLFFHSNLAHASGYNISPYHRKVIILTYNSVNNIPIFNEQSRPEFLVGRDYSALQPLADNALLQEKINKELLVKA